MSHTPLSRSVCACAMMLAAGLSSAQGLPATGIWLASLENGKPAKMELISPVDGYNNQPMFSADGQEIFYTTEQPDGQTDIACYAIDSGETALLTKTPESEYSPTPVPGHDAISVVRVEADQRQRLWGVNLADGGFKLLLPDVEPVGYHAWMDRESVIMFILGEAFTLQEAKVGPGTARELFRNIGRTLRKHPVSGQALFVDKNAQPWRIAARDAETGEVAAVMDLMPGIEDFEVDREGRFWMGLDSKLYRSDEGNQRWVLTADLRSFGITGITRLAASPDGSRLAIVSSR